MMTDLCDAHTPLGDCEASLSLTSVLGVECCRAGCTWHLRQGRMACKRRSAPSGR